MVQIARLAVIAAAVLATVSCATQQESPEKRLAIIYPEDRPFPESRFADAAGLSVHYRLWNPSNPQRGKVLLLHGIGGSTFSFNEFAPKLSEEGYAVVALDLPGFGYSDPALKFEHSPEDRLGLVWTLIDRLDTDENEFNPLERWIVIGHQMGGEFAVWMALDRPSRVEGLVLIATVVGGNRPGGRMAWFPPVRWALGSWLQSSLYTPEGVRELLEDAYAVVPAEQAVDGYLAPLVRDDARRALVNYTRTVGSRQPDLGALQVPVLYVWGFYDTWRSLEDGQEQAKLVPNSDFQIIPEAGHVPTDTHPSELLELFTQWTTAVRAGE